MAIGEDTAQSALPKTKKKTRFTIGFVPKGELAK